jgi:hypothetical protein
VAASLAINSTDYSILLLLLLFIIWANKMGEMLADVLSALSLIPSPHVAKQGLIENHGLGKES